MKKDKILVLLTNYFPFYKGEEYLESELPYLAQVYDHIFILPVMYNNTMKQTREVFRNVSVIKTSTDHSIFGKIKVFFSKQKLRSNFNFFSDCRKKKKIQEFLFELYFYKRSNYLWGEMTEIIEAISKYQGSNKSITIYSYWLYLTAVIAIELKKELNSQNISVDRIISRAHGYDVNENANYLNYLPARNYILSNLDWVFPVSKEATTRLRYRYPHYKDKIQTRSLAVKSINGSQSITRVNDKISIITCSAIKPLKRLDLLIDALEIIYKKEFVFEWIHIGSGEKKYEQKIKKYAEKKLPENSFNFMGYLKNSLIKDLYVNPQYCIFVNVSSSEGVPVSIMEAFSASIPVIATNVGGTCDIVEDGKNGFLVEEDISSEKLAEKILSYYQMDKKEYQMISEQAFLTWNEKLNVDVVYKNFATWLSKEK